MFRNARVGDKVWCFRYGSGEIISVGRESIFPILVRFKNHNECSYTFDGRITKETNPSLFWQEIKYEIPRPPKRMVTKTVECWANIYKEGVPCLRSDKFIADESARNNRIACVRLTGTYEVEED